MSNLKVRNLNFGEGQPKVCVSLIAKDFKELFSEAARLNKLECDIIEWRADYFMYINDIKYMRKAAYFIRYAIEDKPLIFTFRTYEEGGGQSVDNEYYFELNRLMIQTGLIDMIDLELAKMSSQTLDLISYSQANNVKVLLSNHNFIRTPKKQIIKDIIQDMSMLGADICKLAVTPSDMTDVLTILSASNEIKTDHPAINFVLIGMGDVGQLTRMTGELFGSIMTFASSGTKSSASGQMTIPKLRQAMNLMSE
ncbi:type I 3-dehydroquinate dehydratase [Vagococcus vulneris]|uniref:3-dehydroquinate dehydratase n=1 Tax=Vagococcus vulneris TaxID=1977869 RepID=A0A430A231_9ENTE|nr:type I 3-dehydroquinate dehydratase [Vagococcus vulneris]RSU00514.1 type I 3-dehydroquinate dehydratase [Vagococcus vulneris]